MRRIIGISGATLAIAAIMAVSGATASAAQQQAPSVDTVGLGGRLGSGAGLEAPRRDPKTRDASGGFIYRNGRYSPLDSVDGLITSHIAINNRGQTTGAYLRSEPGPGRLRRLRARSERRLHHASTSPPVPPRSSYDINDRGTTVGLYGDAVTARGRFLPAEAERRGHHRRGPGRVEHRCGGINNRGALVGGYLDADGVSHAFVMRGDGDHARSPGLRRRPGRRQRVRQRPQRPGPGRRLLCRRQRDLPRVPLRQGAVHEDRSTRRRQRPQRTPRPAPSASTTTARSWASTSTRQGCCTATCGSQGVASRPSTPLAARRWWAAVTGNHAVDINDRGRSCCRSREASSRDGLRASAAEVPRPGPEACKRHQHPTRVAQAR